MTSVSKERLIAAEFVLLNPDSKPSLTQQVGTCWICTGSVPIIFEAVVNTPLQAKDEAASRIALSELEVDQDWQADFEGQLVEQLLARGTVSWLFGIAVYEVVLHGKPGVIYPKRPRRFLVVQRGTSIALFVANTAEDAFGKAESLAQSLSTSIVHSEVYEIPIPQATRASFGPK